jgi:peptidoglycan/xylan/chitin deacetylase (PgdA/CDA1 family)
MKDGIVNTAPIAVPRPRLIQSVLRRLGEIKRKNLPNILGLVNGGIPWFAWHLDPAPIGDGVPVFCYHHAEAESFGADLQFLKNNRYSTLNADAFTDHLTGRSPAPPNSVVLTFDDGGVSLYDVAFPLLRRFGHTMIAFICPGLHDETTVGGLCSWPQIEEMHTSGLVDVQSHGLEHRLATEWPRAVPLLDADDAVISARRKAPLSIEQDFRRAREILEQRLSKSVRHLAFPSYRSTPQSIYAAQQVGYEGLYGGVLSGGGLNWPGRPLHKIGRIPSALIRRLPGHGRRPLLSRAVFLRRLRGHIEALQ